MGLSKKTTDFFDEILKANAVFYRKDGSVKFGNIDPKNLCPRYTIPYSDYTPCVVGTDSDMILGATYKTITYEFIRQDAKYFIYQEIS